MEVWMIDYGAGNVRSLVNAVQYLGFDLKIVQEPSDILRAKKLLFPGVGACGQCLTALRSKGYAEPLKQYIASGRPFMGICIGLQSLCLGSDEDPSVEGLGIIPTRVRRFDNSDKAVPQIGWNGASAVKGRNGDMAPDQVSCTLDSVQLLNHTGEDSTLYYFVHSYAIPVSDDIKDWIMATTTYGSETFVSAIRKGNCFATQFHPEKSGFAGLRVLKSFLSCDLPDSLPAPIGNGLHRDVGIPRPPERLSKRIIACLDVRTNDTGDLVVTKGDQYDVREKSDGQVRNLGKPVDLARRYFEEGADEVTFLNITSFRDVPLHDLPMLEVLRRTSENVFVPLTIGGGIRDITDPNGVVHSALEVAGEYFRSGADKVSIGSDAVYAAEEFYANGQQLSGSTAIEQIARGYGSQAVVISVDPQRVYVSSPDAASTHHVIPTAFPGPGGEKFCWYQCTVKGGREKRDLDVYQLVTACEKMGAGEILLNCMDKDGTNSGYDLELIADVKAAVHIPVIASSGAGKPEHFKEVFDSTDVEAALAAGIFHRREVPIEAVKNFCRNAGLRIRDVDPRL
ncbi:hypothetical protein DFJ74DRAFT_499568 [Hyaloraphidium curvatum]|nr:hypothetical protein DFJ74DRAFT_499568 [Hyaloraphidium curvatum]